MLKKILIVITLSLLVLLGNYAVQSAAGRNRSGELNQKTTDAPTGTLQKMIVENGSVAMDLDLNRLNGINSATQNLQQAHFAVGANSFFPILVFNDQLRGPVPGSMALIPQRRFRSALPAPLGASLKQLAVEKLPSGQGSDLAVRDSNTGFTFFNIQGHQYDYDAAAQSLAITNGRLLISKEFAKALGRRPTPVQSQERSPSARPCNRSRSPSLLMAKRNRWSCHPCNTQSVPESQTLCPARMLSLEISKMWSNMGSQRDTRWSGDRNGLL